MDIDTITQQLPTTIRAFHAAHEARDPEAALPLLTEDAVVSDVGESFSGEEALRHFIAEVGTEFTYTDRVTGARLDEEVWVVSHHLEGDFPGGTVDLDHRFTLRGERIARLDIVVG